MTSWADALRRERNCSEANFYVALFLSAGLGYLGADRFYVQRPGLGVLKLLTLGGWGVWWLADVLLLAFGRMNDGEGLPVRWKR